MLENLISYIFNLPTWESFDDLCNLQSYLFEMIIFISEFCFGTKATLKRKVIEFSSNFLAFCNKLRGPPLAIQKYFKHKKISSTTIPLLLEVSIQFRLAGLQIFQLFSYIFKVLVQSSSGTTRFLPPKLLLKKIFQSVQCKFLPISPKKSIKSYYKFQQGEKTAA